MTSSASPKTGSATLSPTRRAQPPEERATNEAADAAAFETLLAATRTTIGAQIRGDGEAAAAQVFESRSTNAHERRRDVMDNQYRSALDDRAARMADARTGVDARRGLRLSDGPVPDLGEPVVQGPATLPRSARAGDGESTSAQAPFDRPATPGTQTLGQDAARQRLTLHEQSVLETNQRRSASHLASAADQPVDVSASTDASTTGAIRDAGGSTGGANLAQQIGDLLGNNRVGEVESARAVSPGQGSGEAKSSTTTRQPQTAPRTSGREARRETPESKQPERTTRAQFDRLVQSMRLRMTDRRSTARLRLSPPELGRVRVDVRLRGERLFIDVQTETRTARDLLARGAANLRAVLEGHGIRVDRFEVMVNTDGAVSYEVPVGGDAESAPHREEQHAETDAAPRGRALRLGGFGEDGGSPAVLTAAPEPAVVGETRLDIRV